MSNFVLVHGGMIGGTCWKKIRKPLEDKNCRVWTPTLTGIAEKRHLSRPDIDLSIHIQDISNSILYEELEDVVLVGHSYGGMVITGVADLIPTKIKKLVYVAAVLPKSGESMFDAVGSDIATFLSHRALEGNGWEVPAGTPESYGIFASQDIQWFKKFSTPHPLKSFQSRLNYNRTSFEKLDKTYIHGSQDKALEFMAQKAKNRGIPCHEINAGHFPMITHPEMLVNVLIKLTQALA